MAEIPPKYFSASSLACTGPIAVGSFVICSNIAATNVNAGDLVNCTPNGDPGTTAGTVLWSTFSTAGNLSVRLGCQNGASTCALTARNWKCAVNK